MIIQAIKDDYHRTGKQVKVEFVPDEFNGRLNKSKVRDLETYFGVKFSKSIAMNPLL